MTRVTRPATTTNPPPEITGGAGVPPPPGAPMTPASGTDTPTNVGYDNLDPNTLGALSQEHGDSTPIDPTNIGLSAADLAAKYEKPLAPFAPTGGTLTTSQAIAKGIIPAGSPPGYAGTIPDGVAGAPAVEGGTVAQVAMIPPPPTRTPPPLPPPPPGFQYRQTAAGVMLVPTAETVASAPAVVVETGVTGAAAPPTEPIDLSHHPAASNSDSPSRGVPRPIADPGKQITGGFGNLEAMYYPLDGSELRALAGALAQQMLRRLEDDLRFQMAITYPRIGVVLELRIEGYPDDNSFAVKETVVVDQRTRRELQGEGTDAEERHAPDEFRAEAGLAIPRKQSVGTGTGRQMVDVVDQGGPAAPIRPATSGNVAALTRGGR